MEYILYILSAGDGEQELTLEELLENFRLPLQLNDNPGRIIGIIPEDDKKLSDFLAIALDNIGISSDIELVALKNEFNTKRKIDKIFNLANHADIYRQSGVMAGLLKRYGPEIIIAKTNRTSL